MKKRGFLLLGGAVALLLAAALFMQSSDRGGAGGGKRKLLAGVAIESIEKIVVKEGDVKTTILRTPGGYRIGERNGYPGDRAKIDGFLVKMLNLRGAEWITSDSGKFGKLGVADDDPDAVTVTILAAGEKVLGGVVLGDYKRSAKEKRRFTRVTSRYVRTIGSNDVYLVLDAEMIDPDPAGWLDKRLLSIPRKEIERVTVRHPDVKDDFVLKNSGDGRFELADRRKGEKNREVREYYLESTAEALAALRLKDVMRADTGEAEKIIFDHSYRADLLDGRSYIIETAEKDGKKWLKISVSYNRSAGKDGKAEKKGTPSDRSPEELAARDGERFGGWLFEVYDHDDLRRKRGDLF